jgi:predicted transcriptional regulator
MTALSIIISDALAQDSLAIAKQMHISRTQFIRLAIENQIKSYNLQQAQSKMVSGFAALKKQPDYLIEVEELSRLDTPLIDEGDAWWKE